ncbi:MAG: hypothetical protein HLUCCO16_07050 [Phormidium sp. OSCR]|nr:MAG: hypothetical protein HLUCCO16_07050 [Phormidium sp. OSCR]
MISVITDKSIVVVGFVVRGDIVAVGRMLDHSPTGLGGVALGYACDQFVQGLCRTSPQRELL